MQLGEHFGVLLLIPLYNAECVSTDALFTVQRGEEEGRSFFLLESYILKLLVIFRFFSSGTKVKASLGLN